MSLYLYAIVDRLPETWQPPTMTIGGCPAVARPVHDVVVVASQVERIPLVGPRALAIHRDIVTSTMGAPALLPLPFGTLIADDQVERWLEARWETVEATLERVRGRVEMSVKLLRLDGHANPTERRRHPDRTLGAAEAMRLRALGDRLIEQAEIEDWCYRPSGSDVNAAAAVAFLMGRADVDGFLTRIAPIAAHARGVAVVPTGPWPAYSFVPSLDRIPSSWATVPAGVHLLDRRAG
jgi:Gas vesicle synthesis protein GvpL/GvpF